MTEFNYTDEFRNVDSSLVYNVWYDRPTASAYVDLQDHVYRYDKVPFEAVEALLAASSIGREFNGSMWGMTKGFKQTYGPGTHIGYQFNISKFKRPAIVSGNGMFTTLTHDGRIYASTGTSTVGTPKGLTYSDSAVVDGKPVSEQRVDLKPVSDPVTILDADNEPVRVPLKDEPDNTVKASKFTVHFLSNGEKTYTTEAASVEDAIKNLNDAAEILGVNVKVTGVFHHFE